MLHSIGVQWVHSGQFLQWTIRPTMYLYIGCSLSCLSLLTVSPMPLTQQTAIMKALSLMSFAISHSVLFCHLGKALAMSCEVALPRTWLVLSRVYGVELPGGNLLWQSDRPAGWESQEWGNCCWLKWPKRPVRNGTRQIPIANTVAAVAAQWRTWKIQAKPLFT